jgi:hypothetical protein
MFMSFKRGTVLQKKGPAEPDLSVLRMFLLFHSSCATGMAVRRLYKGGFRTAPQDFGK